MLPKFVFRRRKMKCWGSSETRFQKIWGRTEPSSGGKQPFKVSHFSKMWNFERTFTSRGWLRSASNFGKTRFRWSLTFRFRHRKKMFGSFFRRKHFHDAKKLNFCSMLLASKNEMSGIVWNAFSQSLKPNRAIFGVQTAVRSFKTNSKPSVSNR